MVQERFSAIHEMRKSVKTDMSAHEYLQNFIATLTAHLESYPDLQSLLTQMELALAEPTGKRQKDLILAAFTKVPEIDLAAPYDVLEIFRGFHVSIGKAFELASKEAGAQESEKVIQQLKLYEA
jgi:hypothetical protein